MSVADQMIQAGSGPTPSREIDALLTIMVALRDPVAGCPWDLEQSFETIAPYTIEEAYEVADAIVRGDLDDLRDELGDLLLQVVFHARLAEEQGAFDFGGVVEAITAKLIRRHPHVFGTARDLTADQVRAQWDQIKASERADHAARRGRGDEDPSVLDGIPIGAPALARADELARKAASVGFVWTETGDVLAKVDEELGEVRVALASGIRAEVEDEIGDLLFTVANLARHVGIDPESSLQAANRKFERRFRFVEHALGEDGRTPAASSLEEMDRLWDAAKAAERAR